MHPNPLFRSDESALLRAIVEEAGLGMVFLTTPDGPRVAHTPVLWCEGDRLRFHLARANALTPYLDGAQVLVTVNGPDGYVSPRWYDDRATVPTWDYAAIEMEGRVTRLDEAGLDRMLYDLIDRQETRLGGKRWDAGEAGDDLWQRLLGGIHGYEMDVSQFRATIKLSQKRSPAERERIAAAADDTGRSALARLMREVAP